MNDTQDQPRNESIGALWKKTGRNGTVYYSGKIDGVGEIVAFVNDRKAHDRQPDLRLYWKRERADGEAGPSSGAGAPAAPAAALEDDDIPF